MKCKINEGAIKFKDETIDIGDGCASCRVDHFKNNQDCYTCKFSQYKDGNDYGEWSYECQRFPPSPIVINNKVDWEYPQVGYGRWCGEWSRKSKRDQAIFNASIMHEHDGFEVPY